MNKQQRRLSGRFQYLSRRKANQVEKRAAHESAMRRKIKNETECELTDFVDIATLCNECREIKEAKKRYRTEGIAQFLEDNGWVKSDRGQWYKPNWDYIQEERQRDRLEGKISTGFYGTLNQAHSIQLKINSAPEIEGLEEAIEDFASESEYGA